MAVIHRSIKAFLYPNPMKNARGKFLAHTSKHNNYNIREICESLQNKSGVANVDEMEYHVKLFLDEMTNLLEEGNRINTGYFTAQVNVKGAFDSKGDTFDAKRHHVEAVFSTGHLIRKRTTELLAEIIHGNPVRFGISQVKDSQTKEQTDRLIPNHLLIITGERIKITGAEPSVGLYLTHTESNTEYHFTASALFTNQNATLMLLVPELPAGNYHLRVSTQYSGTTKPLAQARSCSWVNQLTVK